MLFMPWHLSQKMMDSCHSLFFTRFIATLTFIYYLSHHLYNLLILLTVQFLSFYVAKI